MAASRPVKTHYNGGQVASSSSVIAAARAAFRRLLNGDYRVATIVNEHGVRVAEVARGRRMVYLTIKHPRMFK